jgi:hypothetical protein
LQSLEPSDSKVDTSPGYRISIQKTEAPLDSQETSSSDETDTNKQRIANAVPQNDELTFSLFPNALPTTAKPSSPSSTKTKSAPSNRDPLNWYGIPPLRQAQASFISAVESSVPQLLNTSASMHDLEARITKLKIELRLRPGPDADQNIDESTLAQGEDISTTSPNSQLSQPTKDVAHVSTSSRKHLVQRPEPQPRILKLDR